jgi:hypothetical protein
MFVTGEIEKPPDVTTIGYIWKTEDHHEELQNCWSYGKGLIFCCGLVQLFEIKHILMFTFATAVTNDSTLLWLPLVMCLCIVRNVSFDKMFTNCTRVSLVPLPPCLPTLPDFLWQLWLPTTPMLTFATNITSFVTTANPGVW